MARVKKRGALFLCNQFMNRQAISMKNPQTIRSLFTLPGFVHAKQIDLAGLPVLIHYISNWKISIMFQSHSREQYLLIAESLL